VDGITIEAVPAYNTNKQFHPRTNGWLGFILTVDGVRVYHAGDTDCIPEMKDIQADIALLPVSGIYVMTAEEAAQAALAIGPKIAVPMHYGDIVGVADDAERFAAALAGRVRVEILGRG
jgi:L-ascorbate metabolism protein UlaG (beta-lactamase superfamily)